MWLDALLAYAHYTAVFMLFAFLTVEIYLLRIRLDAAAVGLLMRADRWYLASLAAAAVTGLARLVWGAKGAAFHLGAWPVYAKLALVVAVIVLAVRSTFVFTRWSRSIEHEPARVVGDAERLRVRHWLMLQIHLAAAIPFFAVMMARALGR